jgi:hypothetical protein
LTSGFAHYHARGRAAFQRPDALGLRLLGFIETAARLHDKVRATDAGLADAAVERWTFGPI